MLWEQGRVEESWIKEINVKEHSGEKNKERGEGKKQEEKEGRDRKRRLRGAESEKEINRFVDLLLRLYLKSNALFPQPFPSSS